MKYNFKEAKLGPNFCKKDIQEIKKLIDSSTTFSVIGMPGLGISMFLRFLATQNLGFMVHVDINELTSLTREDFFKLFAKELGGEPKIRLEQLVKKYPRVVIIFNRFERLEKEFEHSFFANLRSLRDIDKEKVIMIFAANKPLTESYPEAVSGGNLNMFSHIFYLKPFSTDNLDKLVKLNTPTIRKNPEYKQALKDSGGHYQLLQLLIKGDEHAVKLQLKELYEHLNFNQKKQLQRVAVDKVIKYIDHYLLDMGYLTVDKNSRSVKFVKLFTPLLTEFVRTNFRLKLPVKEAQLFQLLKTKVGKVVSKDEIFQILWNGDEEASDWALNALIYRLRKNPTFQASGYMIESQKKVGYFLAKT